MNLNWVILKEIFISLVKKKLKVLSFYAKELILACLWPFSRSFRALKDMECPNMGRNPHLNLHLFKTEAWVWWVGWNYWNQSSLNCILVILSQLWSFLTCFWPSWYGYEGQIFLLFLVSCTSLRLYHCINWCFDKKLSFLGSGPEGDEVL